MKILSYKKASDIEEKYLSSLVDSEIECWWQKPFDEYKICTNPECKAVFAIEDVYKNLQNYRNRVDNTISENFKCLDCDYKTEFIYEKNEFLEIIKEYIKWEVSRVLLIDESEKVEWFWVLSKDSLENIINYEFATRPNSYDKNKLLKKLSQKLFWFKYSWNEKVALLHQIYVRNIYRWMWFWKEILKNILKNKWEEKIPVILETRYDSEFFSMTKSMWFNDLINDKYWYVVQYISWNNNSFQFSKISNLFQSISDKFWFYKKESLKILLSNEKFSFRKYYI